MYQVYKLLHRSNQKWINRSFSDVCEKERLFERLPFFDDTIKNNC